MKSNIKTIENNLKINFNNKKLLIQSLIHKSYNEKYNNEFLEPNWFDFMDIFKDNLILIKNCYNFFLSQVLYHLYF